MMKIMENLSAKDDLLIRIKKMEEESNREPLHATDVMMLIRYARGDFSKEAPSLNMYPTYNELKESKNYVKGGIVYV